MATTETSPANSSNQNALAALAYLGFFVIGIILLLVEKKNDYVRFHAMQSTIFTLGWAILQQVFAYVPVFGALVSSIIFLVGLVVWIMLLWKSFNGEKYKLPYIGNLAEEQLARLK